MNNRLELSCLSTVCKTESNCCIKCQLSKICKDVSYEKLQTQCEYYVK